MEILQTIWNALATPNEGLIKLFGIPFAFIEMSVTILLALTLLNISSTKKQKISYILILSSLSIFSTYFVPNPYKVLISLIITPLLVILIFKTTILKGIISEILPLVIILIIETSFTKLFTLAFNVSYEQIAIIPIYRECIVSLVYLTTFILYKLFKKYNINIALLDFMDKQNKIILTINFIFGIVAIFMQLFLVNSYSNILPSPILILTTICLLLYFSISIYSLTRTTKLEITTKNLEQAQLYNKSLKILHDNVRAFKHDFSNIVQAIGRICFY